MQIEKASSFSRGHHALFSCHPDPAKRGDGSHEHWRMLAGRKRTLRLGRSYRLKARPRLCRVRYGAAQDDGVAGYNR